jgi:hypothetical protein
MAILKEPAFDLATVPSTDIVVQAARRSRMRQTLATSAC